MTRANTCSECGAGIPIHSPLAEPRTRHCCYKPSLAEVKHPVYKCRNCHRRVELVKVERIEVRVLDESQEGGQTK